MFFLLAHVLCLTRSLGYLSIITTMNIYIEGFHQDFGCGKVTFYISTTSRGGYFFIRQLPAVKARPNSATASQFPRGMPRRWRSSARAYWHPPHRRNQRSPGPTEGSWISAHNEYEWSNTTRSSPIAMSHREKNIRIKILKRSLEFLTAAHIAALELLIFSMQTWYKHIQAAFLHPAQPLNSWV